MAEYDPHAPNPFAGENMKKAANVKVAVRCRPPLEHE